jgi:hypothetical protein
VKIFWTWVSHMCHYEDLFQGLTEVTMKIFWYWGSHRGDYENILNLKFSQWWLWRYFGFEVLTMVTMKIFWICSSHRGDYKNILDLKFLQLWLWRYFGFKILTVVTMKIFLIWSSHRDNHEDWRWRLQVPPKYTASLLRRLHYRVHKNLSFSCILNHVNPISRISCFFNVSFKMRLYRANKYENVILVDKHTFVFTCCSLWFHDRTDNLQRKSKKISLRIQINHRKGNAYDFTKTNILGSQCLAEMNGGVINLTKIHDVSKTYV